MRRQVGARLLLVTPGARPAGSDIGDQKRVMTPAAAIRAGAGPPRRRPAGGGGRRSQGCREAILAEIEGALASA